MEDVSSFKLSGGERLHQGRRVYVRTPITMDLQTPSSEASHPRTLKFPKKPEPVRM